MGEVNGEGEATTGPGGDAVGDGKTGSGVAANVKVAAGLATTIGWVARALLVEMDAGAGELAAQEMTSPARTNSCKMRAPR